MLAYEAGYHLQACLATDYELLENVYTCNATDYQAVLAISKSMEQLNPQVLPFAFFDLHLTGHEHNLLSQIKIKDSDFLVNYAELGALPTQVCKFFNSAIDNTQQGLLSEQLTTVAIKLINNILAASNYNDAVVSMVAYNDGQEGYFPSWHIDKTHAETLNLSASSWDNTQNVFIITLKGASTFYHPMDEKTRQVFNDMASETTHTYGYDKNLIYIPGEGLDKLFNLNTSYSADFGWGSVHLAGRVYGAVHTTPPGEERLLLIVTPGDVAIIKKLRNLAIM